MQDKIRHIIDILKQNPNEYISKEHTIRLIEVWATEDKKAPVLETPEELAIIKNIWRRAYLDSEEDHVKILKEYGQQIASNERTKAIQECQDKIDDTSAEMCESISDFRELIHEELSKLK